MDSPTAAPDSRKRQRSTSSDLSSHASSPKRAASAEAALSPSPLSPPAEDKETDNTSILDQEGVIISSESAASPPSPIHLSRINELKGAELVEGDVWFLVSRRWYRLWESACSGIVLKEGPIELGPVDNSDVVSPNGRLVPSLMEGVNVELVPKNAWDLLVQWYGDPKLPIQRKVIVTGIVKALRIEFYPPVLTVSILTPSHTFTSPMTLSSSSTSTLAQLVVQIVHLWAESSPKPFASRIWRFESPITEGNHLTTELFLSSNLKLIVPENPSVVDLHKTLEEALLQDGDALVFESPGTSGKWLSDSRASDTAATSMVPPPLFGTGTDFFSGSQFHAVSRAESTSSALTLRGDANHSALKPAADIKMSLGKGKTVQERVQGTVGLGNLGNTCFMNSALQCLAHTGELTQYFLTNVFKSELNHTNPLGTGGALASSYGSLLDTLFPSSGTPASSFSPREFKHRIALHAPAFSGYAQHDTQELLAFLLDGLHEDLNRVVNKPYVEKPDWEGGGAVELLKLAHETWAGYMRRNDSVIVDLFQGQYKSTLICPECQKVSITFDPFMYLTLPIPVQKRWKGEVHYVPWDDERAHVVTMVDLPRQSTFQDLKVMIGRWFNADSENILAAEIFNHRFYKYFEDAAPITDIGERDKLFLYELPIPSRQSSSFKSSPTDSILLPVFNVLPKGARGNYRKGTGFTMNSYGGWDGREPYAIPFFVVLDQETASNYKAIYSAVAQKFSRWTKRKDHLYRWESTAEESTSRGSLMESNGIPVTESAIVNQGTLTPPEDTDGEPLETTPISITNGDANHTGYEEDTRRIVDVQDDLFRLWLHESEEDKMESGWAMERSGRLVDWDERVRAVVNKSSKIPGGWTDLDDEAERSELLNPNMPSPLVCISDALICEWNPQHHLYFFGEFGRGEESTWEEWEKYVSPEFEASQAAENLRREKGITLSDCLDEFTKEEKLGQDDLWYCPRCRKHQQATKKFEIWKLPDILVVHLKRFSNSRILRDKIDDFVDFPIEGLDLGSRVGEKQIAEELVAQGRDLDELGLHNANEPLVYDLYAVDEHIGGLGGGHYRAYAKNMADEEWYHFDDSFVTKTRAKNAVNSSAYLLFYRRRTNTPLGGKTHEKIEQARKVGSLPLSDDVHRSPVSVAGPSFPHVEPGPRLFLRGRNLSDASDMSPEVDPPSFENSLDDTLINANHSFEFDYSSARMRSTSESPSSVGAEPDLETHSDSDIPLSGMNSRISSYIDEDYDEGLGTGPLFNSMLSSTSFGRERSNNWNAPVRFGFAGSLPSPANSDEYPRTGPSVFGEDDDEQPVVDIKIESDSMMSEAVRDAL